MESSGSGVTFTDEDLENAKQLVALLNKAKFPEGTAGDIVRSYRALVFASSLLPIMEANIFEIKAAHKAPDQAVEGG